MARQKRSRQIPTRRRVVRVFERHFLRNRERYSGCIRFEQLRDRFGDVVRSLIQDLVKHGVLQRRDCGALAYELVESERIRLRAEGKTGSLRADKGRPLHTIEMDLEDLGADPTCEAREAACKGVSLKVYRLQKQLSELPIMPRTREVKRRRERISNELLKAARNANCVSRINLMAGTGLPGCVNETRGTAPNPCS